MTEDIQGYENSTPLVVRRYYPELDGLRALAILLVLLFHSAGFLTPETAGIAFYKKILDIGWTGVDLFFVLSGFLITGILLDRLKAKNYFSFFYMRRVLRIFPLYYATIILYFLFLFFTTPQKISFIDLSFWFYLQNIFIHRPHPLLHLWSLALEEQFYLVWPFFIYFFVRFFSLRRLPAAIISIIVSINILRFLLIDRIPAEYVFTILFTRFDFLALGSLLAVVFYRKPDERLVRAISLLTLILSGAVVFLILALAHDGAYDLLFLKYALPWVGILYASLIALALTAGKESRFRRWLNYPPLIFYGKISYGIYIFHWPVMQILIKSGLMPETPYLAGQLSLFLLGSLISGLLAALSYRCFEKRFIDLKFRLAPY